MFPLRINAGLDFLYKSEVNTAVANGSEGVCLSLSLSLPSLIINWEAGFRQGVWEKGASMHRTIYWIPLLLSNNAEL